MTTVTLVTSRVRLIAHTGSIVVDGAKVVASADARFTVDVLPPWWQRFWRPRPQK